jgi:hypothetical protein
VAAGRSIGRAALPAPGAHRPGGPLTQMSSPARAPPRSSAWPAGTSPKTVTQMLSGPAVVSPPTSSQPCWSARASRPLANPAARLHRRTAAPGPA